MIRRIFVSETDRTNLSKFKTVQDKSSDSFNYAKVIVNKPWGYEYLMFENDYVAIWILHLKNNNATSMHCHPKKKTSLVVISGKVLASTLNQWFELDELDGIIYEEGIFHTAKALTDDVFLMEIETPSNKADLVRLKDMYGRENKGYEGKNHFLRDLKRFKYIFFDKRDIDSKKNKIINNVRISFKKCKSICLNDEIDFSDKKIYSVLEEKVIDNVYKSIFGLGNIFNTNDLKAQGEIRLLKNCLLLTLERNRE